MTKKKEYYPEVPLFVIATAITGRVKKPGCRLLRIPVVRTAAHQYLIRYKCRARDVRYTRAYFSLPVPALEFAAPDEEGNHG